MTDRSIDAWALHDAAWLLLLRDEVAGRRRLAQVGRFRLEGDRLAVEPA